MHSTHVNLLIVGGGITGLWCLNSALSHGYSAILLEREKIGGIQTLNSQGIIHSGLKYGLAGGPIKLIDNLLSATHRWQNALAGLDEVDLSHTKVMSEHMLLWSNQSLATRLERLQHFNHQRDLQALLSKISPNGSHQFKTLIGQREEQFHCYSTSESVLDMPSLIHSLTRHHRDKLAHLDLAKSAMPTWDKNNLTGFRCHAGQWQISADKTLLCCGKGFSAFQSILNLNEIQYQSRPLWMISVKDSACIPLNGHFFDDGSGPALTITSHTTERGERMWYLGGRVAEADEGEKNGTPETAIKKAKNQLQQCLPQLRLTNAQWSIHKLKRIEFNEPEGKLGDQVKLYRKGNTLVTWPSKMTLAPLVSDLVMRELYRHTPVESNTDFINRFPKPEIGHPLWLATPRESAASII